MIPDGLLLRGVRPGVNQAQRRCLKNHLRWIFQRCFNQTFITRAVDTLPVGCGWNVISVREFPMRVCLKIVYPYTQWLMIIIPIKWLFHWEYTQFSDKPMRIQLQSVGDENCVAPGTFTQRWCKPQKRDVWPATRKFPPMMWHCRCAVAVTVRWCKYCKSSSVFLKILDPNWMITKPNSAISLGPMVQFWALLKRQPICFEIPHSQYGYHIISYHIPNMVNRYISLLLLNLFWNDISWLCYQ